MRISIHMSPRLFHRTGNNGRAAQMKKTEPRPLSLCSVLFYASFYTSFFASFYASSYTLSYFPGSAVHMDSLLAGRGQPAGSPYGPQNQESKIMCKMMHRTMQKTMYKTMHKIKRSKGLGVSAPFFSFGLPCHYSLSDETALVTYG